MSYSNRWKHSINGIVLFLDSMKRNNLLQWGEMLFTDKEKDVVLNTSNLHNKAVDDGNWVDLITRDSPSEINFNKLCWTQFCSNVILATSPSLKASTLGSQALLFLQHLRSSSDTPLVCNECNCLHDLQRNLSNNRPSCISPQDLQKQQQQSFTGLLFN